jgi:hypothetical protein
MFDRVDALAQFHSDPVRGTVPVDSQEWRARRVPVQDGHGIAVILREAPSYGRFGVVVSRAEAEPLDDGLGANRKLDDGIDGFRGDEGV